jgi:alkanesulfonate monooxygenase SsuD/methylene tetrahydromethanopterin reductase-like flavin-dependent oxidoreductase (luciferase family)
MIKPWIFEFMHAAGTPEEQIRPDAIARAFADAMECWRLAERLDYEGIFFSEHHFALSYGAAPNLLIAALAPQTRRMRLGTMGMVLPFYQPWRVVEEIAMLDHLTGGRLEIGCAAGVPQELARIGLSIEEGRERFNEALEIVDAALESPVISHHGKYWSFDRLSILPRPLQQPAPPKWTTVVSPESARKSAGRRSKIGTGFQSVARTTEIFDAYRDEADRRGLAVGPDHLAIRRNISISRDEGAAREAARIAKEMTLKIVAADPRVQGNASSTLDAPKGSTGFSIHDDDFVAGTPVQVAEQLIEQCRRCGAGHAIGIIGRGLGEARRDIIGMFGEEVIPILRRA